MEAAVLAETVEQMMRGLEPDDRSIIEFSLQGYTAAGDRRPGRPRERTVAARARTHQATAGGG